MFFEVFNICTTLKTSQLHALIIHCPLAFIRVFGVAYFCKMKLQNLLYIKSDTPCMLQENLKKEASNRILKPGGPD